MSEVKWYPGPWETGRTFRTHNAPTRYWETGVNASDGCGPMATSSGASLEEAEANAQLIAAAPELYAACSEMIAAVDSEGATGMWFLEAYNSACAALKKARGESGQEAEQR